MIFRDRAAAGARLAEALGHRDLVDPLTLALPRGGVPVAVEVARRIGAPVDVLVTRKVGAPHRPEYGIGAISEGGTVICNWAALRDLRVDDDAFASLLDREREELHRRVQRYRRGRPLPDVRDRDVVLVDDGLATGVTAEAAVRDLLERSPRSVVLAVPVCSREAAARLSNVVDEVVCVDRPQPFEAVGRWYEHFDQTTDEEVLQLLDQAMTSRPGSPGHAAAVSRQVHISEPGQAPVHGDVVVPEEARRVVVFAHGSGSSRHSARNRSVAEHLNVDGIATLLMDLLTEDEARADERSGDLGFDIGLPAGRLESAIDWLADEPTTRQLDVGCFGASTGAAAALVAASRRPERIGAVVSRGGRPDLAGDRLAAVRAPTLLIAGGADTDVLALNEIAAAQMHAEVRLEVVPGATHLFPEPGALERVAGLAARWFTTHLAGGTPHRPGPGNAPGPDTQDVSQ